MFLLFYVHHLELSNCGNFPLGKLFASVCQFLLGYYVNEKWLNLPPYKYSVPSMKRELLSVMDIYWEV